MAAFAFFIYIITAIEAKQLITLKSAAIFITGILFIPTIIDHKVSEIAQMSIFIGTGLISIAVGVSDPSGVMIIIVGFIIAEAYGFLDNHRKAKIFLSSLVFLVFLVAVYLLKPQQSIYTIVKFCSLSIFSVVLIIISYEKITKNYRKKLKRKDLEIKALNSAQESYEKIIKKKYGIVFGELKTILENIKEIKNSFALDIDTMTSDSFQGTKKYKEDKDEPK